MQTTSIRVDRATHEDIKRLASELGKSVGETVAFAVRRLRQELIGRQLATELSEAETSWLDAELG